MAATARETGECDEREYMESIYRRGRTRTSDGEHVQPRPLLQNTNEDDDTDDAK